VLNWKKCHFMVKQGIELGHVKCFLVFFHTPLFMFVRPLALLIFNNFTCFICFVINRPFHHISIEGAKWT
jgi:hypothetical protein